MSTRVTDVPNTESRWSDATLDDATRTTARPRTAPPALTAAPNSRRFGVLASLRREQLVVGLLILVCAVFLFRHSLVGGWTFIGDSDRLNSALNVRLLEVDAIRARGSVSTWNDGQFMGSSLVGLHWMLPAFTPMPYVLSLLPSSQFYNALAVLALMLFALAIGAAYWSFGAYTTDPISRLTGAMLYGLGSYTVHKLTQLDIAFLALVLSPVFLRLVRETSRQNAVRTFLLIAVGWASLVVLTVLQEIAYIGLLAGTYAVFRSIRARNAWPVAVAALAFACGTLIGMPRVLTVATEFPLVARTSNNIGTSAEESLRYFGDGLLGRDPREQRLVRGNSVNLHEGVQLLHSTLAALAVIAIGLVARSWVWRTWAIALAMVLSISLNSWIVEFYDRAMALIVTAVPFYTSRQLQVVTINAVVIGAPLWLFSWWLARRIATQQSRAHGRRGDSSNEADGSASDYTRAAVADVPFLFGSVVLGLAVILIPEVRSVFYHAFLRMDLMHSRISVALTVPLAILATIFVSRFVMVGGKVRPTQLYWLFAGVAFGFGLWIVREAATLVAFHGGGDALNILRPRRLLTIETARLLGSLLVLAAAVTLLVRRTRPELLTMAGGVLAVWMGLETLISADYKFSGPPVLGQSRPFDSLNYMQTPPGLFNVPNAEQREIVRGRVEADQYRVVLMQNAERFAAHPEPHLAAFWNLRLVEGYSTGFPRRMAQLPWDKSMYSPHFLDIDARHALPWRLLAALNVKYAIVVDRALWYNPAPGSDQKPLDEKRLEVLENPYPVTPRAFFAASTTPAGDSPRFPGDDGVRPPAEDPYVGDPAQLSVVEGMHEARSFSTAGTLTPVFDGDRVQVRVDAAATDRFLVLNEIPHPAWSAWVDGQPTPIYPTNLVMRGILVPAGATVIEMRHIPFIASPAGVGLLVAALALTLLTALGLGWALRPHATRPRSGARRLELASRNA